ncbi:MAG TPA: nucleotidyl transferase AbiEii/AbiGii toxin family protein [Desulfobacteraceae bacterium]|nr:nucleotidyl transferase AbiEii/AbiGii toxin family protein [Desulfobacteraceae bacterium]HPJ66353.1 nucleotidyl transferase AbiEii/AbiGii toxin family protein [Desulfobacteraceae bacterium]HPQ27197.1 nucleotidyl transferase AbiEii/AbiGii toxin family protein [Desulfobacteraceae bacterium]
MREASVQLFESYLEKYNGAMERALAETVQSIALLGLSRGGFFSDAAFYGGTALRLLYHLDRFSEDLDFSLTSPNKAFSFGAFLSPLRDELQAFGFIVDIQEHQKKQPSPIASAFIKTNTRMHLMKANVPRAVSDRIHRDTVCKVKLEVDIDPPPYADYVVAYIDEPVPFSLLGFSGPALFAGKMDAVLSRGWLKRVKGRDWFDFAFLVRKNIPLLLPHLEARLRQKGVYTADAPLDEARCVEIIDQRIDSVDFEAAKADVLPFVPQARDLDVWSRDYFRHVLKNMQFTNKVK